MVDVKKILKRLQEERIDNGISPSFVPMYDIMREVKEEATQELRDFVRSKEVNYHKTINGHSFSLAEIYEYK